MGKTKTKGEKRKAESEEKGSVTLFGNKKDEGLSGLFSAAASFAATNPSPAKRAKVEPEPVEPESESSDNDEEDAEDSESEEGADAEEESGDEGEKFEEEKAENAENAEKKAEAEAEEKDDSDSEAELVHESLKTPAERRKRDAKKYVPENETRADRDRRTIFVGNVPIECVKEKSAQSALKAHIRSFVPTAKIESVRFRSVAFSKPVVTLPDDDDEKNAEGKRARREKLRAQAWRQAQDTEEGRGTRRGDDEVADKSKSFLDAKGKRKVAFIKKDIHESAPSCNAYFVFEHAHPDRPSNLPPLMDPYEAASAALAADGSVFMSNTLRVTLASTPAASTSKDAWLPAGTDPKACVFVGGLDYAAKDEDVRAFFEALVVAERGPRAEGSYVRNVRLIRDRDTQLGKGFGYIHFVDRESVDEVIALPSAKLKFAKRPIRVQQCKTLPGPKPKAAPAVAGVTKKAPKKLRTAPAVMPKGNPELGEKLKGLSKEERKAAKASDAERQARRLAKKQAKVARAHQETGAVKLASTKAEKNSRAKNVKAKKGRARSANAVAKMKGARK